MIDNERFNKAVVKGIMHNIEQVPEEHRELATTVMSAIMKDMEPLDVANFMKPIIVLAALASDIFFMNLLVSTHVAGMSLVQKSDDHRVNRLLDKLETEGTLSMEDILDSIATGNPRGI